MRVDALLAALLHEKYALEYSDGGEVLFRLEHP